MPRHHSPLPLPSAAAEPPFHAAGHWHLAPGRALSLKATQAAELRIAQGQVWVTLGNALSKAPTAAAAAGDLFLQPGDSLNVPRGAHLVMEPLDASCEAGVLFDWTETRRSAPALRRERFGREVIAPGRELLLALRLVLLAGTRLARGLLGYGEFVVAGRGRLLAPLEGNPP